MRRAITIVALVIGLMGILLLPGPTVGPGLETKAPRAEDTTETMMTAIAVATIAAATVN